MSASADAVVEVQAVRPDGLWLLAQGRQWFVPFDEYPQFLKATPAKIFRVELLHGKHLHWPELDIDIEVAALQHPER